MKLKGINAKAHTSEDGTTDKGVLCINGYYTYGKNMLPNYLKAVYKIVGKPVLECTPSDYIKEYR